jgi:ribosomal protein S18 acetylase RimI-like enzyme
MNNDCGITRLNKTTVREASKMLARAFYEDPFSLYAFPDKKEREIRLPYMNEISIRYGLRYGEVYTTSEKLEGIAVWMPPGKWVMSLCGLLLSGSLTPIIRMGLKAELKMMPLDRYMEDKHKKLAPFPHWYLALLGVDPQYQKQGYAGKLLRGMFEKIDSDGLPCYLETETRRNVEMYRHFGFNILYEYVLPTSDIRIWAMLRNKAGK